MVETTSASQPASNLIPKRLISHPPAGEYAVMTIKKRVGRTVCVQSQEFFLWLKQPLHPGLPQI